MSRSNAQLLICTCTIVFYMALSNVIQKRFLTFQDNSETFNQVSIAIHITAVIIFIVITVYWSKTLKHKTFEQWQIFIIDYSCPLSYKCIVSNYVGAATYLSKNMLKTTSVCWIKLLATSRRPQRDKLTNEWRIFMWFIKIAFIHKTWT